MCVFSAQYERNLQLTNGTPTRLGDIDKQLNLVGACTHARTHTH
jgi:hypothetical protein